MNGSTESGKPITPEYFDGLDDPDLVRRGVDFVNGVLKEKGLDQIYRSIRIKIPHEFDPVVGAIKRTFEEAGWETHLGSGFELTLTYRKKPEMC